jgi:GWxTD domain-containing protein
MRHLRHRPLLAALALVALAGSTACLPRAGGGGGEPAPEGGRAPRGPRVRALDPITLYADAGLIAQSEPFPFAGTVEYLAGPTPDSTLVLLSLSLANRGLTFRSDGVTQEATYQVAVDFGRDGASARHAETRQSVRVASYRETTRTDESVVFQQFLHVAPGIYTLTVAVRDQESGRSGQHEMRVTVPRLGAGGAPAAASLSSPIVVYQASARLSPDSAPSLIANPRRTVFFGRDSLTHIYLEGYGFPPGAEVELAVIDNREAIVWSDSIALGAPDGGTQANTIALPVADLGVGRLTLRLSGPALAAPVTAPLFVTFGDEWAVTSFEEMLTYLRYFTSEFRIQQLRDAGPQERARAWAAFYHETDPDPATPEHEELQEYFARIQIANERFREDVGQGWLSDRGKVYITLGDPDQILNQGEQAVNSRGRAQLWAYNQHRVQLIFVDQTGFGRWRLTPQSETEFNAVAQRERKDRAGE